jgi:hypothetical protein
LNLQSFYDRAFADVQLRRQAEFGEKYKLANRAAGGKSVFLAARKAGDADIGGNCAGHC